MYSIDVNFLNDREEQKPDRDRPARSSGGGGGLGILPLIIGVAVGVGAPAAAFFYGYTLSNTQIPELQAKQQELTTKLAGLDTKLKEAQNIEAQAAQIKGEADALANVFTQIKPWSALLQVVSELVPPNIQLESLTQADKKLTISGTAKDYADVNDFVLLLQRSPFFKPPLTRIVSVGLTNYPIPVILPPAPPTVAGQSAIPGPVFKVGQVVSYKIETELTDATAIDLQAELKKRNATGLLARIKELREKGVLQ